MKGIVFTEFLEMVEKEFGLLVADQIIQEAHLPSGGSYTAVGTYDHAEMVALVTQLSKATDITINDLLQAYGEYFFFILVKSYPAFFNGVPDAFSFLGSIEDHIHVEVLKLYPDAELPSFDIIRPTPDELQMTYRSDRKMAAFANGLIRSCIKHFNEPIALEQNDLSEDGSTVQFKLTKAS